MTKIGYINERWPESNSHPGVFYMLYIDGQKPRHYYTVDDLRTAVAQCRYNKQAIKRAVRMCNGVAAEFIPETSGEKSQRENENRCESIALEIEAYAAGEVYRCPVCGEILYMADHTGDKYKCPECGVVNNTDDFEQCSVWDYFADALNIEYYSTGRGPEDYTGVRIMIACGGPNIYVDTKRGKVELFWWNEYANFELWRSTCDAIDEAFSEMWACL